MICSSIIVIISIVIIVIVIVCIIIVIVIVTVIIVTVIITVLTNGVPETFGSPPEEAHFPSCISMYIHTYVYT